MKFSKEQLVALGLTLAEAWNNPMEVEFLDSRSCLLTIVCDDTEPGDDHPRVMLMWNTATNAWDLT